MAKSKSPLSGMKKKEKSYIGHLDDLMRDAVDEEEEGGADEKQAEAETQPPAAEPPEAPRKHLNLKIDERLHSQFKGIVSMQGLTMTEVLEDLMQSYVASKKDELL